MRRRYRAIGSPTKAQQARQDEQRANGCAMCRLLGFRFTDSFGQPLPEGMSPCGMTEIHHRTTGDLHGQKQLGQDETIALGAWHHRGQLMPAMPTVDRMRERFGPSLALHKRAFLDVIDDNLGVRSTEALQQWQDEKIRRGKAA